MTQKRTKSNEKKVRDRERERERERTFSLRNKPRSWQVRSSLHFSASFIGVKRREKTREWKRSNDCTEADFVIETFLYFPSIFIGRLYISTISPLPAHNKCPALHGLYSIWACSLSPYIICPDQ